jgi:hypothetical protein
MAVEQELRASVRDEVRFNDGDRGMYASDAGNYRMAPIGVVLPKDAGGSAKHRDGWCSRGGRVLVHLAAPSLKSISGQHSGKP